jgi:hypothetical protein
MAALSKELGPIDFGLRQSYLLQKKVKLLRECKEFRINILNPSDQTRFLQFQTGYLSGGSISVCSGLPRKRLQQRRSGIPGLKVGRQSQSRNDVSWPNKITFRHQDFFDNTASKGRRSHESILRCQPPLNGFLSRKTVGGKENCRQHQQARDKGGKEGCRQGQSQHNPALQPPACMFHGLTSKKVRHRTLSCLAL